MGVGEEDDAEVVGEGLGDDVASASTRVGPLVAEPRCGAGVVEPFTRVAAVVPDAVGFVSDATGVATALAVGMVTAAAAATTGSDRSGTGLEEVAACSAQAAAEVLTMIVTVATASASEDAPLSLMPLHRMPQG